MAPTPSWLVVTMWTGAVLLTGAGLVFARRQNKADTMGGRISVAKRVWLIWAVYAWFVLAPLSACVPAFEGPLRWVLGAFSIFMGLRGAIELFMLYVTKNWRPPMGIAHDVACAALLLAGQVWAWSRPEAPYRGVALWGALWLGVLTMSLCLETYYAVVFHHAVAGQTTGDEGVWFANAEEPRFARANRVTAWANGPLILFVLALMFALSLPASAWAQFDDRDDGWAREDRVQLALRYHDRPISIPKDVFDIVFDGGLTQVGVKSVVASLGAGMRYGLDDNMEIGLRLLRLTMSDLPDTGIDRPTAFGMYRIGGGPFEVAARFETELPTGGGPLQFWLQFPTLVRAGPYVRFDISPVVSAQSGGVWQWGGSVPLEVWGQLTDRLRIFAGAEVGSPDLRRADDLLLRAGGGLAWAFGAAGPSFEVIARIAAPSVALIGSRPADPAFGNYFGGTVTVRAFFQGAAEDPNESLF